MISGPRLATRLSVLSLIARMKTAILVSQSVCGVSSKCVLRRQLVVLMIFLLRMEVRRVDGFLWKGGDQ